MEMLEERLVTQERKGVAEEGGKTLGRREWTGPRAPWLSAGTGWAIHRAEEAWARKVRRQTSVRSKAHLIWMFLLCTVGSRGQARAVGSSACAWSACRRAVSTCLLET